MPLLQIEHVPHGIEDVYAVRASERSPREPQEGEDVSIFIVTRPPRASERVSVVVRADSLGAAAESAVLVSRDDTEDRWQASIGCFTSGTHVEYSIEAMTHEGHRREEGPYSFDILSWHPLDTLTGWTTTVAQVEARLVDDAAHEAIVKLEMIDTDVLRMAISHVTCGPDGSGTRDSVRDVQHMQTTELQYDDTHTRVDVMNGEFQLAHLPQNSDAECVLSSPAGRAALAWLGPHDYAPRTVRLSLALEEDEELYGTGERFDQLNRRGLQFDCHVYEQYKNQGSRTYMPVPLLLSSRGWGCFVTGTRSVRIDAGATQRDVLTIEVDVGCGETRGVEILLFLNATPLDALKAYLRHTILPGLPPDWAFGLWMSANDWNSQARVMAEVARSEAEGIHAEVMVIEAWSDESTFYIWNDAEHALLPPEHPPRLEDFHFPSDGLWPDPKGMVDALHEGGMRLVLWQIPLLKYADDALPQSRLDESAALERGWVAQNPDGTPYRSPGWWFTGSLLPDFTNADAVQWWLSRRRYLVEELGIDGFKTDGGEHLWGRDVLFADGRRGDEMINAFPVLYAGIYHQLMRDCGKLDSMTFSRAGYAGSQQYPAHWAGDENSTWEAFRHSIIAGLSANASGIPFWGWDIAGFSGDIPSGELYRRAWMMSTFCPIMQYHSEYHGRQIPNRDRTPWNIAELTEDEAILPLCRFYTALRHRLRAYILEEARHTAATGHPLMCALPLQYPKDRLCRSYPYEYLFGRDLLIAPTVQPGVRDQRVYLPAGVWRDFWSGTVFHGPVETVVPVPDDRIPVFVRSDAFERLEHIPKELR